MKQLAALLTFALGCSLLSCNNPREGKEHLDSLQQVLSSHKVMLPNGWSLTVPGTSTPLGNFPMNLVVSPGGKYLAITNNGEGKQTIALVNGTDGHISDEIEIGKSWFGLVFNDKEDKLYASGGNDNRILIYSIADGKLSKSDSIELGKPWPAKISPTGLALDDQAGKLFIATKEDSSLYTADLATKTFTKLKLGSEGYACVLSPNKKKLYVSLWGGNGIAVIDPAQNTLITRIEVGSHPNDMVLSRDGRTLYVATANDNGVSVIDTDKNEVREVFVSSLYPDSPAGSTPNALALSADEDRLYIANADNNCLAVFDVSEQGHGKSAGFVPTGWYPTSVKVLHDKLWITNGKGEMSLANPNGPNPYKGSKQAGYIGTLFKGSLSVLHEPNEAELSIYSAATLSNSPYTATSTQVAEGEEGNPIPRKAGEVSPIKHVFYIIKENRTYDQVLGDMVAGNGDSTLCLFPEKVTPNQHALAGNFVLLDNFYVNAEVSADGHNWSTAAYATDFVEKTWPTNYSRRGGEYDFEGGRKSAFPRDGFIWDYASRAGVSYRSYGEFVWNGKSGLESLQGHFDTDYPSYNLSVPDQVRFEHWKQDFDSLLALDAVPQLNTIRLPNDHTAGARAGSPTPRAMVAEHDQSLGRMIEHLSKSKIWKESVVFILEDDAQNGPDHVDAHRSIAYVAGPYVKRKAHVNRMYSTAAMLRTIELILGLPPMSQYDAGSTPMWECFTATPDFSPFTAIPARYDLKEKNKDKTALARQTATFNLVQIDAAPDREFNEVIWKTIHGENSVMPSPVRSAFIKPIPETEDGDDD